jgi:hypothetical protein
MDTSTFDPTGAVVFDLDRGQVSLEGGGALLLIPAELMASVCGQLEAGVVRQLGVALGKQAGSRVRGRLAQVVAPSVELIVDHLGGELSLGGLGTLGIERWGQALVVRLEGYPLGAHAQELLAGYVEGALALAVEREVTALPLERTGQTLRLLLCSKAASAKVKNWLLAGGSWADALAALHNDGRSAAKNDVLGGRS